jgi:16S rRNA (guanine966-N2)-methyltransferase
VTRIISGSAGGTVLDVPPKGTRPTSERVRESLFGALDAAGLVDGARVVDLYAGSGASDSRPRAEAPHPSIS